MGYERIIPAREFSCYLEFRTPEMKPPNSSEGAVEIQYCPWCGRNLREHYASSQVRPEGQ